MCIRDSPWAAAFVLGAIVSPPDAVAATAILSRLNIPRRVVTVLEGESPVSYTHLDVYKRQHVGGGGLQPALQATPKDRTMADSLNDSFDTDGATSEPRSPSGFPTR